LDQKVNAVNRKHHCKNMKHDEEKEIGELISEIIRKGYSEIKTDVNDAEPSRMVSVEVYNPDESRLDGIMADGECLLECFGVIVDAIRRRRCEPTRAQELEKMLADDAKHAAAPPVEIGPDACCGCGSNAGLWIERKDKGRVSWDRGVIVETGSDFFVSGEHPKPGEIGTCPDCGSHYTFGA
jgi:hypothetical protein